MLIGLSLFFLAILVAIQFDRETQDFHFLSHRLLKKLESFTHKYPALAPLGRISEKEVHKPRAFFYALGFMMLMLIFTTAMTRYMLKDGVEQGFIMGTGNLREEENLKEGTIYYVSWIFKAPVLAEGNIVEITDEDGQSYFWKIVTLPIQKLPLGLFIIERNPSGKRIIKNWNQFSVEEKERTLDFLKEEKRKIEEFRNKQI